MSHLTLESLARLVDEPPMPDEAIHLADCAACRGALTDLRAQSRALGSLPPITPPPAAWEKIAARWSVERAAAARHRRYFIGAARVAAAGALFVLGAGVQWLRADRRTTPDEEVFFLSAGRPRLGEPVHFVLPRRPATLDDAIARVGAAELVYRRALLDYSALARPEPPRDVVARLATLDAIVLTTRTALERAPADPVINTYHLAALAERETLLDQVR
jgi:hypothetical protein